MKKYKLPWTHEALDSFTYIDLLTEFYEDHYEENPKELRADLAAEGNFSFEETGDPLLDKWEQEFAQGLAPDLEEGLSESARKQLEAERERLKPNGSSPFGTQFKAQDEKYASKFLAGDKHKEVRVLGQSGGSNDWVDMLGGDE